METAAMGKVVVTAKIENLGDLVEVERGSRSADQVRSVEVSDAMIDTGATHLSIPTHLIDQLGLKRYKKRRFRTTGGYREAALCDAVRLTVQGRDCVIDVAEVPDECPVLIGQVPLELFDFVVDPFNRRLIGNPEHGGEQMYDLF